MNYSFGFTKIKTTTYLLGSAIGFIPVVFINVYAGYELGINLKSDQNLNFTNIFIVIAILGVSFLLIKKLLVKMKLPSFKTFRN